MKLVHGQQPAAMLMMLSKPDVAATVTFMVLGQLSLLPSVGR